MANYPMQFQSIGFGMDNLTGTAFRKIDGFCFTVKIDVNGNMYTVSVPCAVHSEEDAQNLNAAMRRYADEHQKTVKSAFYDGREIYICCRSKDLVMKVSEGTREAVELCMYYIRQYSAVPVCSACGRPAELNIFALENKVSVLCEECFSDAQRQIAGETAAKAAAHENIPLGVIGAVLGGLTGAVLWVLFSLMGKIVFVAGALSALAGYFAYKKLGKKISKKSLVLSLLVSFVFLLAGMYFAIGVDVFQSLKNSGIDISFSEAFRWIPDYISLNAGAVLFNNIFGFISFLAGAALCVVQFVNENKMKNRAVRLA